MDYSKQYNLLIESRRNNKPDEYSEVHHIKPRCLGGDNSPDNLVRLTAKEHYVAHHLLFKIHKTSKLAHAWFSMLRCSDNQERMFTSRQYELARKYHVEALKKSMQGSGNHFYGKYHSEETKKKLRSKALERGDMRTPAQIQTWVENIAKKPKSSEHRKKIGRKGLVMLENRETGEVVRISKTDAKSLDLNIWVNPKKLHPEQTYECEHCPMVTTMSNLTRWHNDNCKHKKELI